MALRRRSIAETVFPGRMATLPFFSGRPRAVDFKKRAEAAEARALTAPKRGLPAPAVVVKPPVTRTDPPTVTLPVIIPRPRKRGQGFNLDRPVPMLPPKPRTPMIREDELPEGVGPLNFVHKRLIGAVTGLITGGPGGAVTGFIGGGGGGGLGSNRGGGLGGSSIAPAGCPKGMKRDRFGQCVPTFRATVGNILTPGTPFTADFGEAVVGAFGVPGLVPGSELVPTLRCPPGTVLGRDDVCYRKGSIPPQFRKWRPGPKPFLSGGDRKCLLKADRLRKSKTSRRILRQLGMG